MWSYSHGDFKNRLYVLRSLQTNYMPFVTMFFSLVHYAMDTGKNEVAAKIFRVYAGVVGKLPSVVLDLSRMAFERVDRTIFEL